MVNTISLRKIAAGTEVFSFGQFGSFIFLSITRSQSQQSECKDLERDGQARAITPEATYVLVYAHNAFASPETCM
ncbi:hypothetical protein NCCP2648_01960 [Lacticaseibacillus rhamnosus]|nr:hypothetical protein NCCP2648_01960 [Lacticaseibacillus rhamnosus]